MIFDVKQKDLRNKARIVVGGHVVDFMDCTTYSSKIKVVSVRLMIFIFVKNYLGTHGWRY